MNVQTKERTERGNGVSGNYRLSPCFHSGTISIVPENSTGLFGSPYDRDLSRKANVLVYTDENSLDCETDSGRYLAIMLSLDPMFKVVLSTKQDTESAKLAKDADIVIPRFAPPLNHDFMEDLEFYNDGTRIFINPPKAQKHFSNKRYLSEIAEEHPELFPQPMVISDNHSELAKFMHSHKGEFVVKPVIGAGANGIEKIFVNGEGSDELERIADGFLAPCPKGVIIQRFIDKVGEYGDKRIQIVGGNPIGAVLRVPAKGEFRCDRGYGARVARTEITGKDYKILEKIAPYLEQNSVYWAGIDIIGPYLGEINAVSPGLLDAVDNVSGKKYRKGGTAHRLTQIIKGSLNRLKQDVCIV